jgi:hypothetical protein
LKFFFGTVFPRSGQAFTPPMIDEAEFGLFVC